MIRTIGAAVLLVLCLVVAGPLDAASARRHRHRNTCGTFCKQAGGLGGNPGQPPCTVRSRVIRVRAGIASVSVHCNGRHTSRGALVIYPHNFNRDGVDDGVPPSSYNGVDLGVRPHRTVTFRIQLSPKARTLLQRRARLRVDVLIELNTKPVVQAQDTLNLLLVLTSA